MAMETNNASGVSVSPPTSMDGERGNGSETPLSIDERAKPVEFKPSARVWLAFLTLAVITLMVALDGTSISVALPVGSPKSLHNTMFRNLTEDEM